MCLFLQRIEMEITVNGEAVLKFGVGQKIPGKDDQGGNSTEQARRGSFFLVQRKYQGSVD